MMIKLILIFIITVNAKIFGQLDIEENVCFNNESFDEGKYYITSDCQIFLNNTATNSFFTIFTNKDNVCIYKGYNECTFEICSLFECTFFYFFLVLMSIIILMIINERLKLV